MPDYTTDNATVDRLDSLWEAAKAVITHWEGMVDDHPDRAGWDFAETIDNLRSALRLATR